MNGLRCARDTASLGGNHLLGAPTTQGSTSLPVSMTMTLCVLKNVLAVGDAKKKKKKWSLVKNLGAF